MSVWSRPLIALALAATSLASCGAPGPAEEPPLSDEALSAVTADPGAPTKALAREVDDLFRMEGLGETRALIVMHDGKLAAERYGAHPLAETEPFWQNRGAAQGTAATPATSSEVPASPISLDHPLQLAEGVRILPLPVVTGDLISREPAITHPDWDRPIAFLRNMPVGRMLSDMRHDKSCRSVMAEWSRLYGQQSCKSAVSWLCGHGILISSQA